MEKETRLFATDVSRTWRLCHWWSEFICDVRNWFQSTEHLEDDECLEQRIYALEDRIDYLTEDHRETWKDYCNLKSELQIVLRDLGITLTDQ